jgi:hypothetical protein
MREAARNLLICMPTDLRGLVDLLMYMEKNFTVLPQGVTHGASAGQSIVELKYRQSSSRLCPHYPPSDQSTNGACPATV